MEIWMWVLLVVITLLAMHAVGEGAMEKQHRPMSRDEIEGERLNEETIVEATLGGHKVAAGKAA